LGKPERDLSAVALPCQDRAAYLDKACDRDVCLRRAIESLLKSHEETGNFVDEPVLEGASDCRSKRENVRVGVSHTSILDCIIYRTNSIAL
jgi:hypothetical protein